MFNESCRLLLNNVLDDSTLKFSAQLKYFHAVYPLCRNLDNARSQITMVRVSVPSIKLMSRVIHLVLECISFSV